MLKIIYITLFFCFSSQSLLAIEYFLTLRYDKVNLRLGPSFEYPIKLFYKKKFRKTKPKYYTHKTNTKNKLILLLFTNQAKYPSIPPHEDTIIVFRRNWLE